MAEDGSIRSPLHDAQVAMGAEIIWEDGWPWTNRITDPIAEYEAIRSATGIWDLFSTCKYEVTGPDAARLIQRRFTNDVSAMQPGRVRYGAFVNADGLMVDDGNVYRHGDEKFWVLINTADLQDWFRETAGDLDATIEHRTTELPMISVQGPTSRRTLQGLTDAPLDELGYFRFWPDPVKVAGVPATVLRTGFSGEVGFELVTDLDSVGPLWDALVAAGGTPFGLEAIDIARIEAGLVIIGLEYQPNATSPYDVSLDRFVKPGTECVGAAALAEAGAAPVRRLKTLRFEGDAPEAGTAVTKDGEEVGTLTSPTSSPRFGPIGLAVVDRGIADDGTTVQAGGVDARVAPLAIYDPEKRTPRG
jgi:aminomethyltransferase